MPGFPASPVPTSTGGTAPHAGTEADGDPPAAPDAGAGPASLPGPRVAEAVRRARLLAALAESRAALADLVAACQSARGPALARLWALREELLADLTPFVDRGAPRLEPFRPRGRSPLAGASPAPISPARGVRDGLVAGETELLAVLQDVARTDSSDDIRQLVRAKLGAFRAGLAIIEAELGV